MSRTTAHRVAQGLAKIALAMRHGAWNRSGPHKLTPTQAQVLVLLLARPNHWPAGLQDVADDLAVTTPTACDAVAALVRKGLVIKERIGRRVVLNLTPKGQQLAEQLSDWPDFLLQALDQLNAFEQGVFLRSLIKMIRSLQDRGKIPVQRMCVECRFFQPHAHPDSLRPHHCHFVDAPFGDGELMIHCRDQQPIDPALRNTVYQLFVNGLPAAGKCGSVLSLVERSQP